jgi:hypothetical protein
MGRTFSWLGQNRRMSKDYERLPESSEAFAYVAMTRLMVRRLARSLGYSDSPSRGVLGKTPLSSSAATFCPLSWSD